MYVFSNCELNQTVMIEIVYTIICNIILKDLGYFMVFRIYHFK